MPPVVSAGESLNIDGGLLQFDGLRGCNGSDGREIVEAVTALYQGNQTISQIIPRRDYFTAQQQNATHLLPQEG